MTKEAQTDRTATDKFNVSMTTESEDRVGSTGKRKQDKRSSDGQESTDLRQPKDPDPVDVVEAEVQAILGHPITLSYLRNLCNDAVDELHQGNECFRAFHDLFASKFSQTCEQFDAPFNGPNGESTCEDFMNDIVSMQKGNMRGLIDLLAGLIDPETADEISDTNIWSVRELTMRIAQQDPTTFFKSRQAREDPDSIAKQSFWDTSDGEEMRLRADSAAVRFWVCASCLLGHPWRYFFHIAIYDPSALRELDFPLEPKSVETTQTPATVTRR